MFLFYGYYHNIIAQQAFKFVSVVGGESAHMRLCSEMHTMY